MNFLDIVFASFFANNLLFFHFFGLSEFLGTAGTGNILRRTVALTLLLLIASAAYWVPDHFLLQPFHLEVLRSILLLAVLWMVTSGWAAIQGTLPGVWPQAREFLVHSLLVGGVLLVGSSSPHLVEVLIAAVAVSLGYAGALVLLSAVSFRMARDSVPRLIHGLPLQLLTLGLVWLVLQGLGFAFAGKGS